jgi:hypothetical protein
MVTSPGVQMEEACQVRLDRLIVGVPEALAEGLPEPRGFKRIADYRIRPQGKFATYARVQKFKSKRNACQVSIQYKPRAPWLPWCRITMIGDDRTGLTLEELKSILADCPDHRISLVELAFDFHPDTLVDESFVLSNCRFGKARLNKKRRATGYLRYGGRGSPKLVRCYPKLEIGRYRVELETHSVFLRKRKINTIVDLPKIVDALYPDHISFRAMKWKKLEAYLRRRYGKVRAAELIDQARECADVSLRRATRFLSKSVYNVHRFWGSEATNRDVRNALKRWASDIAVTDSDPVLVQ